VFGLDRSDIVQDWYGFGLCPTEPGPTPLPFGLTLTAGGALADVAAADTVIVPAWPHPHDAPPPPDGEQLFGRPPERDVQGVSAFGSS
jgi:hypothetical protein